MAWCVLLLIGGDLHTCCHKCCCQASLPCRPYECPEQVFLRQVVCFSYTQYCARAQIQRARPRTQPKCVKVKHLCFHGLASHTHVFSDRLGLIKFYQ